jgi:hypothetical protein
MSRRIITLALLAVFLVLLAGCKRDKWYDAKVELTRVQNIRQDATGKPTDMDVELSWFECPGTQIEVIRGDAAFAECMKKYKVGDKVPVRVQYHWDSHGFWDWDIHEMGGCKRPPDPEDLSSFDTVQECEPIIVNGVSEGFHCNRIPQKELLKKCPWFGRN